MFTTAGGSSSRRNLSPSSRGKYVVEAAVNDIAGQNRQDAFVERRGTTTT